MLPINPFNSDVVDQKTPTEQKIQSFEVEDDNGWKRIRRIFQIDEFNNVSPEANSILQVAAMSTFVGAIYGGVMSSRTAYTDFMQNNQATAFKDHIEAKKKLQDKVTLSFGKGAYKWGWRITLFTTSFVGVSTMIAAYRGKSGIAEYVAGGAVSGAMYKFNMGPRGWLVGGALGSGLGLVCGCVTQSLLYLTGISMEEARYWQYHWKQGKDDYFKRGVKDYMEQDEFALIKLHNLDVGERGKDLGNIEQKKS